MESLAGYSSGGEEEDGEEEDGAAEGDDAPHAVKKMPSRGGDPASDVSHVVMVGASRVASNDGHPSGVDAREAPRPLKRSREDGDGAATTTTTGRVRAFPHVDGNFATHVCVPLEVPTKTKASLGAMLAAVKARFPSLRPCGREDPDPTPAAADVAAPDALLPEELHVSLSRVFPIRWDQRETLAGSLRRHLRATLREAFDADVGPAVRVLANDERTTTFLALAVEAPRAPNDRPSRPAAGTPSEEDGRRITTVGYGTREVASSGRAGEGELAGADALIGAIGAVDAALSAHGCPTFYADPALHVSLMWAPGDVRQTLESTLTEMCGEGGGVVGPPAGVSWRVRVNRVVCRVSGLPEQTVWARYEGQLAAPVL